MAKQPNKLMRFLYLLLGSISLGLGTVGMVLPILPTVPFYLLTAFLYAKGSARFHQWFVNSKLYKRYISGLTEHKTMSLGGQLTLLIFVSSILLTVSLIFINSLAVSIVLPLLDLIKYTYFITRIKVVSKNELLVLKQEIALKKLTEANND